MRDYVGNLKDDILTLLDQNILNIIRDSVDNDYHVRNKIVNLINQHKINDIEFKKLLIKHIGKVDIDYDNGFASEENVIYTKEYDGACAIYEKNGILKPFREEDYGVKKYVGYCEKSDKFIYVDLLNGGFASLFKDYCVSHGLTFADIIKIIEWYLNNNLKKFLIEIIGNVDIEYDNGFALEEDFVNEYDGACAMHEKYGIMIPFDEKDYINNFKSEQFIGYCKEIDKFINISYFDGGFGSLFNNLQIPYNVIYNIVNNEIKKIKLNNIEIPEICEDYDAFFDENYGD